MSPWDPAQYERFKPQRSRPFYDLMELVARRPGMCVLDLGCGTGELTRRLHQGLEAAQTLGIDSSDTMLERSASIAGDGLRFECLDINIFEIAAEWDLVFSNAALHWIQDHPGLLARLTRGLKPAGQLAIQVPANHDHAAFLIAAALAREPPFVECLNGYAGHRNVLSPERYAEILYDLGFPRQRVRLQVYAHELPDAGEVVEWVKGTTLTAYAERLPPNLYSTFEAEYRRRLLATLGPSKPILYTFKRIFIWGQRPPADRETRS